MKYVYRSSPFRSTLNTGYITAFDMCEVCTEAVHSIALWTRVTVQLWTCVKYVSVFPNSATLPQFCVQAAINPVSMSRDVDRFYRCLSMSRGVDRIYRCLATSIDFIDVLRRRKILSMSRDVDRFYRFLSVSRGVDRIYRCLAASIDFIDVSRRR